MKFTQLKLINFKNYQEQTVSFHPKFNLFLGLNGMGKSNLLDAVHYCCLGKSYFTSLDKNVINHNAEFFRLEANIYEDNDTSLKFVAKVVPGNSKFLEINNKELDRLSDHIGKIPCVVIAPKDVQSLLDASEDRRAFIDSTICQYDKKYLLCLFQYLRILKQRNALLKTFAEKRTFDKILIETLDEKLIEPSVYIFSARKDFLNEFGPYFKATYETLCDHKEDCTFEYKSSLSEMSLIELLTESLEKDRILTRTTKGIHKDDLELYIGDVSLKTFASQGQMKSFVISMKLAQYNILKVKTGKMPLLLLDDLFDKLDQNRVTSLLHLLSSENYGQVFITDTNIEHLPVLLSGLHQNFKTLIVEDGRVNDL